MDSIQPLSRQRKSAGLKPRTNCTLGQTATETLEVKADSGLGNSEPSQLSQRPHREARVKAMSALKKYSDDSGVREDDDEYKVLDTSSESDDDDDNHDSDLESHKPLTKAKPQRQIRIRGDSKIHPPPLARRNSSASSSSGHGPDKKVVPVSKGSEKTISHPWRMNLTYTGFDASLFTPPPRRQWNGRSTILNDIKEQVEKSRENNKN